MDADSFKRDFILYDTSYQSVEVTGSWCNWERGRHVLTKIPGLYFITSVDLPYGQKVLYKYIINGEWKTVDSEPTETGSDGLVNNVFQVPEQKALDGPVVGSTSNPREEPIVAGPPSSSPSQSQTIVGSGSSHGNASDSLTDKVEKVAPGVVEATPSGHGVSDRELAKTDVGGATLETKNALANSASTAKTDANAAHLSASGVTGTESNVALVPNGSAAPGTTPASTNNATSTGNVAETARGAAAAVAAGVAGAAAVATATTKDAVDSVQKSTSTISTGTTPAVPSSSSTSGTKAPLPASTRDAPTAPGTHVQEGQGLFSAISHLASAATVAAQNAAERVVHAIDGDSHTIGTSASEGPRTATQTPAFGLQGAQASVPTVPSGSQVSSAVKAHPAPTAQASSPKEPAAALAPIATNDGVAKITKELGTVDLQHTKLEVTHAVESLGGAIAGALASIGASAEGRVFSDATASSASAKTTTAPALSSAAAPVPAPVTATNASTASNAVDSSKPSYLGETREATPKAATGAYIGTGSSTSAGSNKASYLGETREATPKAATGSYIGTGTSTSAGTVEQAVASEKKEVAKEVKETVPTVPATSVGTGGSSATTAQPSVASEKKEVAKEIKETVPTVPATAVGTGSSTADSKSAAATTTPSNTIGKKEGSSFTDKLKRRVSKIDPSKDESSSKTAAPPVPSTASAPSTPKKSSSTPSSRILPDNDKKLSTPTADLAKRGSAATASGVTGTSAADKTKPSTTSTAVPGAAKRETGSSLGVASGAGAASSLPPTTPKKAGAADNVDGTPASARTDGAYKTAPSTPSTPADRKRKSSFFQKVKKAFSP